MRPPAHAVLLLGLLAARSGAAVEPGESPYLYGLHDWTTDSAEFLIQASAGSDCARGWLLHAEAIGHQGYAGSADFGPLTSRGLGVIVRLDDTWSDTVPRSEADLPAFASTFADYVSRSRGGAHVWIVGNEPNLDWGHGALPPAHYARAYLAVRDAVHALPGRAGDQVLVAPPGIWADLPELYGDWLEDYFRAVLDELAGRHDGFAIHAYTRSFEPAAASSEAMWPDGVHTWHFQFRVYQDVLGALRARGILDVPLYITEAGNVCDPPCDPYPDQNLGYFQALYEEVHAWNLAHPDQLVRALTPYRWTRNDDGSGRDFCIGCSGPLLDDLRGAIATGRRWTTGCPGGPVSDQDQDGYSPPADCDDARPDVHPGASEVCGDGVDQDCAGGDPPCPDGQVTFAFEPAAPVAGEAVDIDVAGHVGHTNIGLGIDGPGGSLASALMGIDGACVADPGDLCHWRYRATFGLAGLYHLTFSADPDATVYGRSDLLVSTGTDPDGGDAGDEDGGDQDGAGQDGAGEGDSAGDGSGLDDADVDGGGQGDDGGGLSDDGEGPGGDVAGGCGAPGVAGSLAWVLGLLVLWRLERVSRRRWRDR
ncbi:MAG TPA: putative metal-binding motif-containing protein [Myxococcota bacterium]|nr:putative metal-binding motif-containing protein [Myxococcota bacterium]HRY95683.1 putative metal-binding motif-containing protein [Myxococcota bacterium]HSA24421.1 putative metal-binding motif-containing protein [Myxococcota bacterium]